MGTEKGEVLAVGGLSMGRRERTNGVILNKAIGLAGEEDQSTGEDYTQTQ